MAAKMTSQRCDGPISVPSLSPEDRRVAIAIPLLNGLDPDHVERLLSGATVHRVRKGGLLFEKGCVPDFLHMLLYGSVDAFTTDADRDCTVLIFSDADIVMPAASIVDDQHLVSARAMTPVKLLLIPAEAVRREMAQCPMFACRLAVLLAGQLRIALRHIIDLKTRTGPQRLAAYLLRLIEANASGDSAELPFAKGMLASRLGMSAESMSRSLKLLADHGLTVRGHRVELRDRDQAMRFCKRNSLIDEDETMLGISAW